MSYASAHLTLSHVSPALYGSEFSPGIVFPAFVLQVHVSTR